MDEKGDSNQSAYAPYAARVILRFKPDREVPHVDDPVRYLSPEDFMQWNEQLTRFGQVTLIPSMPGSGGSPYFRVSAQDETLSCEALAGTLLALDSVASAYVQEPATLPGFRDPKPVGMDVTRARDPVRHNLDGGGVRVGIVERGWSDSLFSQFGKGSGVNSKRPEERQHGDGVLALVRDIAPKAEIVLVSSVNSSTEVDVARAIQEALNLLRPGDILLIQEQVRNKNTNLNVPVEYDAVVFEGIRKAVLERNIVVVEPSGNFDGFRTRPEANLDHPRNAIPGEIDGKKDRPLSGGPINGGPPGLDSGAVMVSACKGEVISGQHERRRDANFGTRVDCFGIGDSARTISRTCAAAAMVAAAAALIQSKSAALRSDKKFQKPACVREFLKRHGTPVVAQDAETHIEGLLPNLEEILGLPLAQWNHPVP